jgi:3-oxoacyl-[acyl-carrier protein] reductase
MVEMRFKGKTVIITGASGGIGSETARLFAKEGSNIIVNYFSSPDKADNTVRMVKSLGVETFSFKADVSNPKQVSLMVKETVNRLGRIDVLVNNAAKHPPPMFDFEKPDWEFWKRMVHINVMGVLVCSHFAAPYLKKTGGNIVNIVMDYDPGGLGYILTKTAGTPLTRGLAAKLAPIRVNAVSPGYIDTWGMTEEEKNHAIENTLLKRVGQPLDIAKGILFLASEKASYITGETIHIDGGSQLFW